MFPALANLGQAYFHQEFIALYGSPDAAIREFGTDASPTERRAVIADLQAAIDSDLPDDWFEPFWLDDSGANFDPVLAGMTYREWFGHVLDLLVRMGE